MQSARSRPRSGRILTRDYQAYYAQEAIPVIDDPTLSGVPDQVSFPSRSEDGHRWFGNTLVTLGRLNRNEDNKDKVRELLATHANSPSRRIQQGAIKALGLLEDPKGIPIVASFARGGNENTPVQEAADAALKKLRGEKKVSVELKDLTSEVMKLKEKNEKLESELKDLKKQFDAKERVDVESEKSESQGSDD